MPGQPVTPQTTIAVILGASSWPLAPKLPPSEAFQKSANDLIAYLTDQAAFGLPNDDLHLLNLFDNEESPNQINGRLSKWLRNSQAEAPKAGNRIRDLIVFYVGHGGFTPGEQAYFLALRSTEAENEGISSLRMTDLARTIKREAKALRRFLILDCCFAESAYELFQSAGGDPANAAHTKSLMDFPEQGTALLCSSSARDVSIAPKGELYTMFSGALLEALRTGDPTIESPLSLEHVGRRVARIVGEKYPDIAVRPKVSVPDELEGNIADLPIFPNAANSSRPVEQRLSYSEQLLERSLEKLQILDDLASRIPVLEDRLALIEQGRESRDSIPQTNGSHRPVAEQRRSTRDWEDRILRKAPARVQIEVKVFRQAKRNGIIWLVICSSLSAFALAPCVIYLFPEFRTGTALKLKILQNPFSWLTASLAVYTIFAYQMKQLISDMQKKKSFGSLGRPWETLPIVLEMKANKLVTLFGNLKVSTPRYEVGAAIVISTTILLLAVYFFAS